MSKLEEHMVLNPELKKTFDDTVRRSKAKAKLRVRNFLFSCCILRSTEKHASEYTNESKMLSSLWSTLILDRRNS